MRKAFIIITAILLSNCKYDDIRPFNKTWETINFKTDYRIQIPDNFDGPGMAGFEGNTFSKHSKGNTIIIEYSYCGPLFCYDFGDTLDNSIPSSIKITDNTGNDLILNKTKDFFQGSALSGILYYSENSASKGRLYWKDNGLFKQAAQINFDLSELETVEAIIKTIERK